MNDKIIDKGGKVMTQISQRETKVEKKHGGQAQKPSLRKH